jgi:predicted transcriptional regulator
VKKWTGCCLISGNGARKAAANDGNNKIILERRIEMGIASEMKELTRNIAFSHKDRTKGINEIRKGVKGARVEARDLIHSFKDSRQETNRQLRQNLARDKTRRKSETTAILEEAQNIIKDFKASRKEAGVELRNDLSRATTERQSEVKKTLGEAQKLIKGFGASRQKVSNQLRKDLGLSRANVKYEVGELRGNAQSLIKDFQTSRREAASQLRGDLSQSKVNRESDVKQMLSDFSRTCGDVRADLKEARDAWRGLASNMQAKVDVAKNPPTTEAPIVKEEIHDLETKMLAAVGEYPVGGITLAELANILGVAPVVLGRVSKSLMKKGKIRKAEKLYFPAASQSKARQGHHFKPPLR